jgi:hypothetical protein
VFRISVIVSARAHVAEASVTSAKIASEVMILLRPINGDIVELLPAFSVKTTQCERRSLPLPGQPSLLIPVDWEEHCG